MVLRYIKITVRDPTSLQQLILFTTNEVHNRFYTTHIRITNSNKFQSLQDHHQEVYTSNVVYKTSKIVVNSCILKEL